MENSKEGYVHTSGGKIWYQIVGKRNSVPLLILHGGPGYAHNYLEPLERLAIDRPIIFYDQLGCGKSDHPNDPSNWNINRFREEINDLRLALGIDQIHLLGHSWGSILAVEYVLAHPNGIQSMVLSSPCLSVSRWIEDSITLISQLPPNIQEIINRHQVHGTTQSQEYASAVQEFERRFLCRLDPIPEPMLRSREAMNRSIYNIMWGPSEFFVTGILRDYDCTPNLHKIAISTLFTCGHFDEATPRTIEWYSKLLPKSEIFVFEQSAHMPHLEETESYLKVVRKFLCRIDNG